MLPAVPKAAPRFASLARAFLAALLAMLALGCSTAAPSPWAATPQGQEARVVLVSAYVDGAEPVPAGAPVRVIAHFAPTILRPEPGMTSWTPWTSHTIAEMRVCLGCGQGCDLAGWEPYAERRELALPVEWLGAGELALAAEFRDASGRAIPCSDGEAPPAQRCRKVLRVRSALDQRTPLASQPAAIQTAAAAAQARFPVSGSLQIEGGAAAAGGKAGSTITLTVTFQAASPLAAVTQMRVSGEPAGCSSEVAIEAPWEPFVPHKTYSVTLPIGWAGFYQRVQYRDAQGNLSPVYCDDISLEGNP